jgi:hypothetical protein
LGGAPSVSIHPSALLMIWLDCLNYAGEHDACSLRDPSLIAIYGRDHCILSFFLVLYLGVLASSISKISSLVFMHACFSFRKSIVLWVGRARWIRSPRCVLPTVYFCEFGHARFLQHIVKELKYILLQLHIKPMLCPCISLPIFWNRRDGYTSFVRNGIHCLL